MPPQNNQEKYMRVSDVQGKGKGYLAQCHVQQGTEMMEDFPLRSSVYVLEHPVPDKKIIQEIATQIKENNLDLHYAQKYLTDDSEDSKWWARARTNSFQETLENSTKGQLFLSPKISYLNHSCSPNASLFDRNGAQIVVALKDIKQGDEICICYDPELLYLPTSRRKPILQNGWEFECTCDRCTNTLDSDKYLTAPTTPDATEPENINKLYEQLIGNFPAEYYDRAYLDNAVNFMKLPLHSAHWRVMKVRKIILEFLCGDPKILPNPEKYWTDHISAQYLHCPGPDSSKMKLFRTYLRYYDKDTLRKLDPSFDHLEKYM